MTRHNQFDTLAPASRVQHPKHAEVASVYQRLERLFRLLRQSSLYSDKESHRSAYDRSRDSAPDGRER